jgi:hypothetical protein
VRVRHTHTRTDLVHTEAIESGTNDAVIGGIALAIVGDKLQENVDGLRVVVVACVVVVRVLLLLLWLLLGHGALGVGDCTDLVEEIWVLVLLALLLLLLLLLLLRCLLLEMPVNSGVDATPATATAIVTTTLSVDFHAGLFVQITTTGVDASRVSHPDILHLVYLFLVAIWGTDFWRLCAGSFKARVLFLLPP